MSAPIQVTVPFENVNDPTAKIVKGYPAVMPTYKGTIKEKEIDALIAYLKTVK